MDHYSHPITNEDDFLNNLQPTHPNQRTHKYITIKHLYIDPPEKRRFRSNRRQELQIHITANMYINSDTSKFIIWNKSSWAHVFGLFRFSTFVQTSFESMHSGQSDKKTGLKLSFVPSHVW